MSDDNVDRREVLKKSAMTASVLTGGMLASSASASASTTELVIEGEGEYNIHLYAKAIKNEEYGADVYEFEKYDFGDPAFWDLEGKVESDARAVWLIGGFNGIFNGNTDAGVDVYVDGEKQDL